MPQRSGQLDLGPDNSEQSFVVPRIRHEIACTAFHRLDREINRRPCSHHHDGQSVIDRLNLRDNLQTFLARGRVAGIIEIHHQKGVILFLQRVEDARQRSDGISLMAFAF